MNMILRDISRFITKSKISVNVETPKLKTNFYLRNYFIINSLLFKLKINPKSLKHKFYSTVYLFADK